MKKIVVSIIVLVSVIIVLFSYYGTLLSSKYVFPHTEKIYEINYGHYIQNGEVKLYSKQFLKTEEIDEILRILDSEKYRRSMGTKNIKNNNKVIIATVLYYDEYGESRNYNIEINDKGELLSNNKKYHTKNNKINIFNSLYEYFNIKL